VGIGKVLRRRRRAAPKNEMKNEMKNQRENLHGER
jgi:hypothetical protein